MTAVDTTRRGGSAARTFHLGAVPGATPGTWIATWRERMPDVELMLHALPARDARRSLDEGVVDAALVRLPIDREGLHVIKLYDEVPVVVMSTDSSLSVAAELDADDLAGETLIVPRDDVFGTSKIPNALAPTFDPPTDTAEAVATIAAGVGIMITPMSLARLHHRRDVTHRPLRDGPVSAVALAWVADRTTPDIETFVGIVRGRTANSSR